MRNQEQIRELKQISIIGYLATKGIKPVSQSSGWLMYHSPLREGDNKPSFGVHSNKNIYNDLASGDKGNVIELVMRLELIGFHKACEILERLDYVKEKESFFSPSNSQTLSNQTNTIKSVKPLQHQALIKYCHSRGISFGVGFLNDSGGYAVRSQLQGGKINIGSQYFTSIIVPDSQCVMVFEGFFNFLSAVEYYGRKPSMTAIILNSTSNLNKALPTISQYAKIYAYLDNDDSGRKALEKLKQIGKTVIDQSEIYQGYNDFNEFLIVGTKPP